MLHDKNHMDTANIHQNIGHALRFMNDYDGSLIEYNKCVVIRETVLGTNHVDTADVYASLGHVHMDRGNYQCAIAAYHKSLNAFETIFNTNGGGDGDDTVDGVGSGCRTSNDSGTTMMVADPKVAAMHLVLARAYKEMARINIGNNDNEAKQEKMDGNHLSDSDYRKLSLEHATKSYRMYEFLYDVDHVNTKASKEFVEQLEQLV